MPRPAATGKSCGHSVGAPASVGAVMQEGGGRATQKQQERHKVKGDCLKNGVLEGIMEGKTIAKFLFGLFAITFGHVGPGGAQMTE